jgi:hypothetical protein
MSDKNNSNKPFVNRTKWEQENRTEKKRYLVRKQEEKESRRARLDFQYHSQVEDFNERRED